MLTGLMNCKLMGCTTAHQIAECFVTVLANCCHSGAHPEALTCCIDEVEPGINGALVGQPAACVLVEDWLGPWQCIGSISQRTNPLESHSCKTADYSIHRHGQHPLLLP